MNSAMSNNSLAECCGLTWEQVLDDSQLEDLFSCDALQNDSSVFNTQSLSVGMLPDGRDNSPVLFNQAAFVGVLPDGQDNSPVLFNQAAFVGVLPDGQDNSPVLFNQSSSVGGLPDDLGTLPPSALVNQSSFGLLLDGTLQPPIDPLKDQCSRSNHLEGEEPMHAPNMPDSAVVTDTNGITHDALEQDLSGINSTLSGNGHDGLIASFSEDSTTTLQQGNQNPTHDSAQQRNMDSEEGKERNRSTQEHNVIVHSTPLKQQGNLTSKTPSDNNNAPSTPKLQESNASQLKTLAPELRATETSNGLAGEVNSSTNKGKKAIGKQSCKRKLSFTAQNARIIQLDEDSDFEENDFEDLEPTGRPRSVIFEDLSSALSTQTKPEKDLLEVEDRFKKPRMRRTKKTMDKSRDAVKGLQRQACIAKFLKDIARSQLNIARLCSGTIVATLCKFIVHLNEQKRTYRRLTSALARARELDNALKSLQQDSTGPLAVSDEFA